MRKKNREDASNTKVTLWKTLQQSDMREWINSSNADTLAQGRARKHLSTSSHEPCLFQPTKTLRKINE